MGRRRGFKGGGQEGWQVRHYELESEIDDDSLLTLGPGGDDLGSESGRPDGLLYVRVGGSGIVGRLLGLWLGLFPDMGSTGR